MDQQPANLGELLAPVWARKWLIALVTVLAGVATYAYYDREPRVYETSTSVYVGRQTVDQLLAGGGSSGANTRDLTNQTILIRSSRVGAAVARRLKLDVSPSALTGAITATASDESDFFTITARSSNPAFAARVANGFAATFIDLREEQFRSTIRRGIVAAQRQRATVRGDSEDARQLRGQIDERLTTLRSASTTSQSSAQQVDRAGVPSVALSPNPRRNAVFGGAIGLILSAIAAYGLASLDQRRIRELGDLAGVFGAPLLTAVPHVRGRKVLQQRGAGVPVGVVEAVRALHTKLRLVDSPGDVAVPRVILVTSAQPGDGKSTLVQQLAQVQAAAGERVAVVDGDLRRPAQAEYFTVARTPGLTELVLGDVAVDDALRPVEISATAPVPVALTVAGAAGRDASTAPTEGSIHLLSSGAAVENPPTILGATRITALLDDLRERYDSIIIDSPPPLAVSDVLPLLPLVDGILLVARTDRTSFSAAERLVELLRSVPRSEVLGVVAMDVREDDRLDFGYSSYNS